MFSDISIDGVFVPGLLAVALIALALSMMASRLLASLGCTGCSPIARWWAFRCS